MRKAIVNLVDRRGQGQHSGLLLHRYLNEAAPNNPRAREALLAAARVVNTDAGLRALYASAFQGREASFPETDLHLQRDLKTDGRMIVGLGSDNVLETGITLQHTYGVPIIPGSALKGLASHYCDHVWGRRDRDDTNGSTATHLRFRRPEERDIKPDDSSSDTSEDRPPNYHRLLFGTTEDAGVIVFHDAWITPESLTPESAFGYGALRRDVMTPHHPQWNLGWDRPPTDFDNPVPVSFLSVAGTFRIRISWNVPDNVQLAEAHLKKARDWTRLAIRLLEEALVHWGVGGKTSSGYGRLVDPVLIPKPAPDIRKEVAPVPGRAPEKREYGLATKVTILGPNIKANRKQSGFKVKEEGYPEGKLTLGNPPVGINTDKGTVVDVQVKDDDPKNLQYMWPSANTSTGKTKKKPPRKPRR